MTPYTRLEILHARIDALIALGWSREAATQLVVETAGPISS